MGWALAGLALGGTGGFFAGRYTHPAGANGEVERQRQVTELAMTEKFKGNPAR